MKKKGAEATVTIGEKVVKTREPKKYRHEKLDQQLRNERTQEELRLMEDAGRHGVSVPEVEKINDTELEIERIDGKPLKEVIDDEVSSLKKLGINVAYLHSTDIIHGDITTSNILVAEKPYLIDFGLAFRSRRIEDKSVDLHLFKQVLESSHPDVAEDAWNKFLEGYSEYDESEEVLEQLEEVEQRGRYK